jgi:membrane-associated phospholipid phosphatase
MFLLQSQGAGSWIDGILRADQWLMFKINREAQGPVLDHVALFAREATAWAPLYVFLIAYMVLNHGRQGWWWVLAAFALVGACDLVSSHVIKVLVHRLRPCRDPFMAHEIRFIAQTCGLNGSFVSSHASNHFTMATFIYGTLGRNNRAWAWFFAWAALICWAQVYVGVHYPTDVLGGALLGTLIGQFGSRLFNDKIGLTNPPTA